MRAPTSLESALAAMIRRRNREIAVEAVIACGMGLVALLLTMTLPAVALAGAAWRWRLYTGGGPEPWIVATVVAVAVLVLCLLVARQSGDGFDDEPSPGGGATSSTAASSTSITSTGPRFDRGVRLSGHTVPTSLGLPLLAAGPCGVVEGIRLWRHGLPSDRTALVAAATLLVRCATPVPADEIEDARAFGMLRRLQLLRTVRAEGRDAFTLTTRGDRLLGSRGDGGGDGRC